MSCFDNLIGIKGCGTGPHPFYINQLTGITIPDFDKAISNEEKTAAEALQEIIQFAGKIVEEDIISSYNGQLKSVIENDTAGYYTENKVLMPAQPGVLTGYEIRINEQPHLTFHLEHLSLFADYTGSVDVHIYDLIQGKPVDTISVDAIEGEITTISGLGKTYTSHQQALHLFIGYESQFGAYKTSLYGDYKNTSRPNRYASFRSAQINTGDPKTSTYTQPNHVSGGAGLSIGYSLQCSITGQLCTIKNKLAITILYKAGAMVMKELKHSRRLTGVVTTYEKNYEELMLEYEKEYQQRLRQVLQTISIPESICYHCSSRIKAISTLP